MQVGLAQYNGIKGGNVPWHVYKSQCNISNQFTLAFGLQILNLVPTVHYPNNNTNILHCYTLYKILTANIHA